MKRVFDELRVALAAIAELLPDEFLADFVATMPPLATSSAPIGAVTPGFAAFIERHYTAVRRKGVVHTNSESKIERDVEHLYVHVETSESVVDLTIEDVANQFGLPIPVHGPPFAVYLAVYFVSDESGASNDAWKLRARELGWLDE